MNSKNVSRLTRLVGLTQGIHQRLAYDRPLPLYSAPLRDFGEIACPVGVSKQLSHQLAIDGRLNFRACCLEALGNQLS